MNSLKILSLACVAIFLIACGVMWGTGVFAGLSAGAVAGTLAGILFATAIGTALTVLAVYSDKSGHDDMVFRSDENQGPRVHL